MNRLIVTGNVGKIDVTQPTAERKKVRISIADERKVKGEKKTEWFTVERWFDNDAKFLEYLQNARRLSVVAHQESDEYQDKKYSRWIADDINIESYKDAGQQVAPKPAPQSQAQPQAESNFETPDLPF